MNPEHLEEQQEAVEAARQELDLRKHQLDSGRLRGRLASIGLPAALIVAVWLYHTEYRQNRETGINSDIQGLKLSTVKQQDEMVALGNASTRLKKSDERLEDQQQMQAAQIAVLRGDLRDQKARAEELEQQLREIILGRTEDKKELEQLKIENRVLQEQVAANDSAQAKQADLLRELQRTKDDRNKETPRKRSFLGIFHSN